MKNLPKPIHYGLLLLIVGAILGGLLVLVNSFTSVIIAANEIREVEPKLQALAPECSRFEVATDQISDLPDYVSKVFFGYEEEAVTVVIYWTETPAYGNLVMKELIAIDVASNKILNVVITSSILTSHGKDADFVMYDNFFQNINVSTYANQSLDDYSKNDPEIISGATVSSLGVLQGVIIASMHYQNADWGF
ncbi:MAG: hypothetical protein WCQ80_05250 [Bacilli bacterium]